MRNIKFIIEYDGTKYNGWQSQKNGIGIQEMMTNAIHQVTGEEIKINEREIGTIIILKNKTN